MIWGKIICMQTLGHSNKNVKCLKIMLSRLYKRKYTVFIKNNLMLNSDGNENSKIKIYIYILHAQSCCFANSTQYLILPQQRKTS